MLVDKNNIAEYLPQRPPFVMIDQLLEAENNRYVSEFWVSPDNLFVEKGELREFGLIENMAQTGAAGIRYSGAHATMLSDGFIGAISKLQLYDLPKVGDCIRSVVTTLHTFDNLYLLKCECFAQDKKLLECEMKLAGMKPK